MKISEIELIGSQNLLAEGSLLMPYINLWYK
jgi:hypothetical protein